MAVSGVGAASGVSPTFIATPSSPFVPTDSQLRGAQILAAAQSYQLRRRKKEEEDVNMREPALTEEVHLEPITEVAPPARSHSR